MKCWAVAGPSVILEFWSFGVLDSSRPIMLRCGRVPASQDFPAALSPEAGEVVVVGGVACTDGPRGRRGEAGNRSGGGKRSCGCWASRCYTLVALRGLFIPTSRAHVTQTFYS